MEIRKAFRAGNSLVVSLPREAVEAIGISEGVPVAIQINTERRQLTMRVVELDEGQSSGPRYARMVEDFIDKYEQVLRELG